MFPERDGTVSRKIPLPMAGSSPASSAAPAASLYEWRSPSRRMLSRFSGGELWYMTAGWSRVGPKSGSAAAALLAPAVTRGSAGSHVPRFPVADLIWPGSKATQ